MKEGAYRSILAKSPFGYACYQIIFDGKGNPLDYQFLEVITAFEDFTGLKCSAIIGKTVCEIFPNVKESNFNFSTFYDDVALNGGELN